MAAQGNPARRTTIMPAIISNGANAKKKVISKEKIENRVVLECRKLLTDNNIEHIAASVAAVCESDRNTVSIKRIKTAIQEADTAIENLWKALEKGQAADMITERIEKRQKEKRRTASAVGH